MHLRDPFASILRYGSVSANPKTKGLRPKIDRPAKEDAEAARRRHAINYESGAHLTRYATRLRMFMSSLTTGLQWLYTTLRLRQALPVVVLISYSLIGAGIFYATEHQAEIQVMSQTRTNSCQINYTFCLLLYRKFSNGSTKRTTRTLGFSGS